MTYMLLLYCALKLVEEIIQFILSVYLLITIDTLFLSPSLHFTTHVEPLHYTCRTDVSGQPDGASIIALGQVFLYLLRLSPACNIPPSLHTHYSIYYRHRIILATGSVVKNHT